METLNVSCIAKDVSCSMRAVTVLPDIDTRSALWCLWNTPRYAPDVALLSGTSLVIVNSVLFAAATFPGAKLPPTTIPPTTL